LIGLYVLQHCIEGQTRTHFLSIMHISFTPYKVKKMNCKVYAGLFCALPLKRISTLFM